jgi:hypothetical protein
MSARPRPTLLELALLAMLSLLVLPVVAADGVTAPNVWVAQLGKGAGPWRIGMPLVVRRGLVATERFPENDTRSGCTSWSRIDHYRDVRVAWQFSPDAAHSDLVDVATSRRGDRSEDGFTVGLTPLRAVLARHHGRTEHPRYSGSLGLTLVTVERSLGDESSAWLKYWFDASNTLTALETGTGGC